MMRRYIAALYRRTLAGENDGIDLNAIAVVWLCIAERRAAGTLTAKDKEFLRGMEAIVEKYQAEIDYFVSAEDADYYKDPPLDELIEFIKQTVSNEVMQKVLIDEVVGSN